MRRLRKTGKIPAVLYGHGEGTLMLSISSQELNNVIRAGNHVVKLKGGVDDTALIKDIQWDPMGSDVLHLDLSRVAAGEAVQVTLSVELKGVAPGTKSGGTLRHRVHEIDVECPADKVPEKIEININELQLDQSITAGEIEIPEGAKLLIADDEVVVQCVVVEAAEEPEPGDESVAAEPEVIGRKKEDEEDNE